MSTELLTLPVPIVFHAVSGSLARFASKRMESIGGELCSSVYAVNVNVPCGPPLSTFVPVPLSTSNSTTVGFGRR